MTGHIASWEEGRVSFHTPTQKFWRCSGDVGKKKKESKKRRRNKESGRRMDDIKVVGVGGSWETEVSSF